MELIYQERVFEAFKSKYKSEGFHIVGDDDPRVQHIKELLPPLIDACVYFSPECKEYMNHLKLLVVESEEQNAFMTLGMSVHMSNI